MYVQCLKLPIGTILCAPLSLWHVAGGSNLSGPGSMAVVSAELRERASGSSMVNVVKGYPIGRAWPCRRRRGQAIVGPSYLQVA